MLRQSSFRPRLDDGEVFDPVAASPSPGSDPEGLIAEEERRGYLRHFADDPAAMVVILEGWGKGWSRPEIEKRVGLSQKAQRAAVRRVRRYAWRGLP